MSEFGLFPQEMIDAYDAEQDAAEEYDRIAERAEVHFETIAKGYRRLSYAYLAGERVGHVGWCPAAVRNRRAGLTDDYPKAGWYAAFTRDGQLIGDFPTLAAAKAAVRARVLA